MENGVTMGGYEVDTALVHLAEMLYALGEKASKRYIGFHIFLGGGMVQIGETLTPRGWILIGLGSNELHVRLVVKFAVGYV